MTMLAMLSNGAMLIDSSKWFGFQCFCTLLERKLEALLAQVILQELDVYQNLLVLTIWVAATLHLVKKLVERKEIC